ncbi:MAG: hypothetical protein ACKO96_01735 [Flammeovirgaceae bacterium]
MNLKDLTVMSTYREDDRSWALACQNEDHPYGSPGEPYENTN